MKSFIKFFSMAACSLTLGASLSMAAGHSVAGRQVNQQRRIAQGVRSGELTRPETRRLERRQVAIHRSIVHDRIDGGAFTARERAKAQRRLNRESNAIYRQKHDRQSR